MAALAHGTRTAPAKTRTAAVMMREPDGSLLVRITETRGRKVTEADYGVWRLPADFGAAFRVFKLAEGKSYDINLDAEEGTCECLGHLAHGHKTVCKHVALCRELAAAGTI